MSLKHISLSTALIFALTACGGGSDNQSQTQNNTGSQSGGSHAGGGGSGNQGGGQPATPKPNTGVSDIDLGKQLITTAKRFITDMDAVADVYEAAANPISRKQQTRLSYAFDIADTLELHMLENNIHHMSTADIIAHFQTLRPSHVSGHHGTTFIIAANSNASARLDNTGKFTLHGVLHTTAETRGSRWHAGQWISTIQHSDTFPIDYNQMVTKLSDHRSTTTPSLSYSINALSVGNAGSNDFITLTAKNSVTATARFNKAVIYNDDFHYEDAFDNNQARLEEATIRFDNVILKNNKSTFTLKNLEYSLIGLYGKQSMNAYGGNQYITAFDHMPYKIKLSGNLNSNSPQTNLDISLSAESTKDAIRQNFTVNNQFGAAEEIRGRNTPITASLSLKGTVAKSGSATVPIDLQAQLERNANNAITLKNASAVTSNQKPIHITGGAQLDANGKPVGQTRFEFTQQGKAKTTLVLNANNKPITNTQGKISDIVVNGKDVGDLRYSGSRYSAVFNDNTFIHF